ncbi:MAG: precorrin-6A/cobalt-precorrin-6A reductase [Pseudomonadales bacterium]|nr:precorrin-6A/cobalt-precorrin-6A reductase [Pseudomonadales bacterium]NRA14046.1 precorrin-6A/cobalt-precorrin-6A reductase [Oceanospirillaceae bacterium]
MKLLLLGGTADARKIAAPLIQAGVEVIYSVAGLVRKPDLACAVISGGFSKTGGMQKYLIEQQISGVLDATHPYAVRITESAQRNCQQLNIPYWRFSRDPWVPQSADNWLIVDSWSELIAHCSHYRRPFLTTGQLSQSQLEQLAANSQQLLYRTAAAPVASLAANVQWLKAIGPFGLADELAIMEDFKTDLLVCKNAGGAATYAKLEAARQLQIRVLMLARPVDSVEGNVAEYSSGAALVAEVLDSRK